MSPAVGVTQIYTLQHKILNTSKVGHWQRFGIVPFVIHIAVSTLGAHAEQIYVYFFTILVLLGNVFIFFKRKGRCLGSCVGRLINV